MGMLTKTNLYDSKEVFYLLDLISNWFKTIAKNNKSLPSFFDYNNFLKGK